MHLGEPTPRKYNLVEDKSSAMLRIIDWQVVTTVSMDRSVFISDQTIKEYLSVYTMRRPRGLEYSLSRI